MSDKKTNKNLLDGLCRYNKPVTSIDLPLARFINEHKNTSVLLSRKKGSTKHFFTEDSNLYITPKEFRRLERGEKIVRIVSRLDSALSRSFEKNRIYSIGQRDLIYLGMRRRYSSLHNYFIDLIEGGTQGISVVKMWNLSIVGAVIFGMLTMTMIYRYLGQNVSAAIKENAAGSQQNITRTIESDEKNVVDYEDSKSEGSKEIDTSFVTKLLQDSVEKKSNEFEEELKEMVKGYPIEKMIPEIAKKDRTVATFIVAIAKKESNWGKRVPVLNGQDCYNYWGYRGVRDRMGTGGHTCFDSPKDAVDTVAKRIEFLVSNKKLNTPDKMVIWKCGSNCAVTGGQAAANKWISDVSLYFDKLNKR
ncbi:MAG TPA: hypothetical protein DIC35_01655 [Candidatus Moranbacteria bacterium]|nr:hypothetical protein [Candidatus Moranbacteria bacterium]